MTAELAILRLIRERPGAKAIYVAPLKALARERLDDWRNKLGRGLGLQVGASQSRARWSEGRKCEGWR